jgi:hypothetical protein
LVKAATFIESNPELADLLEAKVPLNSDDPITPKNLFELIKTTNKFKNH